MEKNKVIELDLDSIVGIIDPKTKFLLCLDEKNSVEIKVSKHDRELYTNLREGMDELMQVAQNNENYDAE